MKVYHVTEKRRLKNILRYGLDRKHRKNVPISLWGVNYVFTSKLEAGFFASDMSWKLKKPVVIITMDVPRKDLKQDLNVKAIMGKWMYTEKNIEPSQIKKVEDFDKKFITAHMKRMKEEFS